MFIGLCVLQGGNTTSEDASSPRLRVGSLEMKKKTLKKRYDCVFLGLLKLEFVHGSYVRGLACSHHSISVSSVEFVTTRAISSNSMDVLPNAVNSCPASPSSNHRLMKVSGSEVNVWSRLSTTSSSAQDSRFCDTKLNYG